MSTIQIMSAVCIMWTFRTYAHLQVPVTYKTYNGYNPTTDHLNKSTDLYWFEGCGSLNRWHRRCEYKSCSVAPDEVDKRGGASNVPSQWAKPLAQRPRDDVELVCQVVPVSYPPTSLPIQTNSMDLVDERDGVVSARYVAYLLNGADGPIHRVDWLKHHYFGPAFVVLSQLPFQIFRVIVTVDLLVRATTPYSLDERVMVPFVREVHQTLYLLAECGESGLVGYVTGGEQQSRFLPVYFSQRAFQLAVVGVGTWDVTCTSCSATVFL